MSGGGIALGGELGLLEPLLAGLLLVVWGAQAVGHGRAAAPGERRIWRLAALPLLVLGAWCALRLLAAHPDEALAEGLGQVRASNLATVIAVLFCGLALASLLAWVAGERLEPSGWRLLAGFAATFLAAAMLGAELLRIGESRSGRVGFVLALAACRFLVALGAGEAVAPGPPRWAVLAAPALALYPLLLPQPVFQALLRQQGWTSFAGAALLFLLARWLPQRLRRPALVGAALLAGVAFTLAAALTHQLGPIPVE